MSNDSSSVLFYHQLHGRIFYLELQQINSKVLVLINTINVNSTSRSDSHSLIVQAVRTKILAAGWFFNHLYLITEDLSLYAVNLNTLKTIKLLTRIPEFTVFNSNSCDLQHLHALTVHEFNSNLDCRRIKIFAIVNNSRLHLFTFYRSNKDYNLIYNYTHTQYSIEVQVNKHQQQEEEVVLLDEEQEHQNEQPVQYHTQQYTLGKCIYDSMFHCVYIQVLELYSNMYHATRCKTLCITQVNLHTGRSKSYSVPPISYSSWTSVPEIGIVFITGLQQLQQVVAVFSFFDKKCRLYHVIGTSPRQMSISDNLMFQYNSAFNKGNVLMLVKTHHHAQVKTFSIQVWPSFSITEELIKEQRMHRRTDCTIVLFS